MKKLFSMIAALLLAGSMLAGDLPDEDFTKGQGDWTIKDVTLNGLSYVWQQGSSYGMKASAYNKQAYVAESWLISPKFDFSPLQSLKLTINHALNKGDNSTLEVVASKDGKNWTTLKLSSWPSGTSWTFEEATADLSAFDGEKDVQIAFVYTSTTDNCPTWEIKSVRVTAEIAPARYYLIGSRIGYDAKPAFKLTANPKQEGEYTIKYMATEDEFLTVKGGIGDESDYWMHYGEYEVSETGFYTVYFRPEGNPNWSHTYLNLEKQDVEINTCNDVYSKKKGATVRLNTVLVTYVNLPYVYVKDDTGAMLIYLKDGISADWKAGDRLSGLVANLDIYNGLYELKPTAEQVATVVSDSYTSSKPEVQTAVPGSADMNKYVLLKGVRVDAGTFTTSSVTNLNAYLGEDKFVLRNNFKFAQKFEAGKLYDIVGTVAVYEKDGTQTIQLYFISAEVQPDPIDITISSDVIYHDYSATSGYWIIYGANDNYAIQLSNNYSKQAPGTYAFKDLYPYDCWLINLANPSDTIWFSDGQVELAVSDENVVTITGQLKGEDKNTYNINLTYKDPVAEQTVIVNIPDAKLYEEYVSEGVYVVYGTATDNTYVQFSIYTEGGFQGEFTEANFVWYVSSYLRDAKGKGHGIFSAAINVTPGNAEGVYTVTADLLCYNSTLYKVTMMIDGTTEAIRNVDAAAKAVKTLRNGILVIEKNNARYNAVGQIVN